MANRDEILAILRRRQEERWERLRSTDFVKIDTSPEFQLTQQGFTFHIVIPKTRSNVWIANLLIAGDHKLKGRWSSIGNIAGFEYHEDAVLVSLLVAE